MSRCGLADPAALDDNSREIRRNGPFETLGQSEGFNRALTRQTFEPSRECFDSAVAVKGDEDTDHSDPAANSSGVDKPGTGFAVGFWRCVTDRNYEQKYINTRNYEF